MNMDLCNKIAQGLQKHFNYKFITVYEQVNKQGLMIYITRDPAHKVTDKTQDIALKLISICNANRIQTNLAYPNYTVEIDGNIDPDMFIGLIALSKGVNYESK